MRSVLVTKGRQGLSQVFPQQRASEGKSLGTRLVIPITAQEQVVMWKERNKLNFFTIFLTIIGIKDYVHFDIVLIQVSYSQESLRGREKYSNG